MMKTLRLSSEPMKELKILPYRDSPRVYDVYRKDNLDYIVQFNRLLTVTAGFMYNETEKTGVNSPVLTLITPIPNGLGLKTHCIFIPGDYVAAHLQWDPKSASRDNILCKVTRTENHIVYAPVNPDVSLIMNQTLYVEIVQILKEGDSVCVPN